MAMVAKRRGGAGEVKKLLAMAMAMAMARDGLQTKEENLGEEH